MRAAIIAACALMVLAVSVVEVHAREWRVRLDGAGEFTTIGAAIEAASEGDTISIGPGDYSGESLEPIEISLTMRAMALPHPMMPEIDVRRVNAFVAEGLEFRGHDHAGMYSQAVRTRIIECKIAENRETGLVFYADSVWVVNCAFERNRGGDHLEFPKAGGLKFIGRNGDELLVLDGCMFVENGTLANGGAVWFAGESISVTGTRFEGNEANRGGAIYVEGSTVQEVRDCYFYGNEAEEGAAIHMLVPVGGPGFVIENNTFVKNVSEDSAVSLAGDAYISNNIFAFNDCFGYWVDGFGRCGCNLFWRNRSWGLNDQEWGGFCGWPEGTESNEVIDPGFCNRREDDYTLTATSPGLPANFTELFREQGCEGRVGAFEMGCQVSPTREASWGELKRLLGGAEGDSVGVLPPHDRR